MKKRIITAMAILTVLLCPMIENVQAQVFLDDEDMEQSLRANTHEQSLPIIPQLNSTYDQYAPLGGEILALSCLGGIYLLRKKHKDEQ
jgi:hypothetical protein